ncbi:DUF4163 domain-containing protein [Parasphingopyxis sp. CP4]|uniref:hypothetical protein n=1 Tax=Parasphingopyxis sp. CP4 TaxID=2724527 RepID=UPI0015A3A58E|nr:hypothetical protein [Parasphingopyxis sp. CP4]QLC21131.1 DUF4163 domain-containing protein [Parasphingopyxis sp. CP4]
MKNALPFLAAALLLSTVPSAAQAPVEQAESEPQNGFSYSYPEERLEALPQLAEQMAVFADSAERDFATLVAESEDAMPDSPALANLTHSEDWGIAGETETLLSLAGTIYEYAGGAHGNTEFASLLWDVRNDRMITLTQLFTDRYSGLAEIDGAYCANLQAMQREHGLQDGEWGDCPLLHDMTVVPVAVRDGAPFTTIRVLVPPYAAGPFSLGPFEVDVPVSDSLIALVKPEFRSSFASGS